VTRVIHQSLSDVIVGDISPESWGVNLNGLKEEFRDAGQGWSSPFVAYQGP
jgi:hypothetical protein